MTYIYGCRFRFCRPYANGYPGSGDTPYYVSAYDDDGEAEEVGTQEDGKSWHGVPRGVMLRWTRRIICQTESDTAC